MTAVSDQMVKGHVEYTDRAFEQDTHDAMRGDIVRGLIELITNADDAYTLLGDGMGKILVEVEHRKTSDWKVVVKDRASGMTQEVLVAKIVKLAERVSGFESGRAVRGNLGRGAKDVSAFGPTMYESISGDQYAYLQLLTNGHYTALKKPRKVTSDDRKRLGIPRGNGTAVTVLVGVRTVCPNHGTLMERLAKHFQLRDIMSDARREVVLVNLNSRERDRLRFAPPASALLRSVVLDIPGYPGASASVVIGRLPERCDRAKTDPFRPCGLLLKGQRAIYENTLFSSESNPYASFISGRVECPYIDVIAREYDDRRDASQAPTVLNPMPIITRSRDGLQSDHPFYVALKSAVDVVLADVVREEEERIRREASRMENEKTRRSFDRLVREVARFMEDELRDAEAEVLPPGGGNGRKEPEPLVIVPGEATCYLDQIRTLTVIARREGLSEVPNVKVFVDPEGVVELVDGGEIILTPHKKRDDVMVGQLRLRPLVPDVTLLQCEVEGREAEAIVEVREEKATPPPPEPPTCLEFERPRYRIGWMKKKTIVLRAPREVFREGSVAKITSDSPGIAVLTGNVALEKDPATEGLRAEIRLDARALHAEAQVEAWIDGQVAQCHVLVSSQEEGPSLRFELVDEDQGIYRALWKDVADRAGETVKVLQIMGRHTALKRYLGDPPEFPGQETPLVKALMAEIIADNVCREIGRRVDALRTQDERPDADAFYIEHYSRLAKILPKLHALMLGVPPAPGGSSMGTSNGHHAGEAEE